MVTQWFCKIMGDVRGPTTHGPLTREQLQAMAIHGELAMDDFVRTSADDEWLRAENVSGLFEQSLLELAADVARGLGSDARATCEMPEGEASWCALELQSTNTRASIRWSKVSDAADEASDRSERRDAHVQVPRRTLKVGTGAKPAASAEKLASQSTAAAGFNSMADTVPSTALPQLESDEVARP